jgi:hypothetical protein
VRTRFTASLAWAGAVFVLLACGTPLTQQELDCEEAVSVLQSCCPGFDGSPLVCTYSPSQGCEGSSTYPAISEDDSACIRRETCSQLVRTGVCTRAQQARAYTQTTNSYGDTSGTATPPSVCP